MGYFRRSVFVGEFMGVDVTYDNTVLVPMIFDQSLDPQGNHGIYCAVGPQRCAKQDLRSRLRKSNMIDTDRTDEDIETDVEVVNRLHDRIFWFNM